MPHQQHRHAVSRPRGVYELDFRSIDGSPILVAVDRRAYAVAWMIVARDSDADVIREALWNTLDAVDPEQAAATLRIV